MNVIIVGGGAAGMMAAYAAAECGHAVTLLEQNEKLGKKLFLTGKGRCNLTNACAMEDMFGQVMSNRKFLYSAFYACTNEQVMDFFRKYGTPVKVERGNRVFPLSDHSSDVIGALKRALNRAGVEIQLNKRVQKLLVEESRSKDSVTENTETADKTAGLEHDLSSVTKDTEESPIVTGVELADGTCLSADHVIVATGGISYPSTGATGDGYRFAEECGHTLVTPHPSLVPMNVREPWVRDLQGLSLKNTGIRLADGNKTLYEEFGEMLFTHFGVSGPMILSASAAVAPRYFEKQLTLWIDLKPALTMEQMDRRLLRDFEEMPRREFKNALGKLFPAKLVPVMVSLAQIDPEKEVGQITRIERQAFAYLIKHLPLTVTGLRGFEEAIITKGGISVHDVDPSTMRSKRVQGLSFCGEVLDLDAQTGGYNLQIAWSTGYLAGSSLS